MPPFSRERYSERVQAGASLLAELWGDALPPGTTPWQRVAEDAIQADDRHGQLAALAVQSDVLTLSVLAEVLSYVPAGASLRDLLSDALVERLRVTAEREDPAAAAWDLRGRQLSCAIRTTGAAWVATYLLHGGEAILEASLGMTPWERVGRARIALAGAGPLCQALLSGETTRGSIPVTGVAAGRGHQSDLVLAPCVAVPFPLARSGAHTSGALLLVWEPESNPDAEDVAALIAPLAAESERRQADPP